MLEHLPIKNNLFTHVTNYKPECHFHFFSLTWGCDWNRRLKIWNIKTVALLLNLTKLTFYQSSSGEDPKMQMERGKNVMTLLWWIFYWSRKSKFKKSPNINESLCWPLIVSSKFQNKTRVKDLSVVTTQKNEKCLIIFFWPWAMSMVLTRPRWKCLLRLNLAPTTQIDSNLLPRLQSLKMHFSGLFA